MQVRNIVEKISTTVVQQLYILWKQTVAQDSKCCEFKKTVEQRFLTLLVLI